jgi:hypothetical protein
MMRPKILYETADALSIMLSTNPFLRLAYSLAIKSFDEKRSEQERDDCRREALLILDKLASD